MLGARLATQPRWRSARSEILIPSATVVTVLQLKGSLFDVETIGTVEVSSDEPPQVGDVVECGGKSYTVTDLIEGEMEAIGADAGGTSEATPANFIAIVEPLAVSQRRGR